MNEPSSDDGRFSPLPAISPFIPSAAPRSSLGQRWPGGEGLWDIQNMVRSPRSAGRGTQAGKLGAKRALKPQQVWAIRFWLDRERRLRDRAMFDRAIESKLRRCDVVKIKIGELVSGGQVRSRAIVIQQKTRRAVQFELLEPARGSILAWLERRGGTLDQ